MVVTTHPSPSPTTSPAAKHHDALHRRRHCRHCGARRRRCRQTQARKWTSWRQAWTLVPGDDSGHPGRRHGRHLGSGEYHHGRSHPHHQSTTCALTLQQHTASTSQRLHHRLCHHGVPGPHWRPHQEHDFWQAARRVAVYGRAGRQLGMQIDPSPYCLL